jgi:tetrapyrrole methylase family protein / MazG family protein
MGQLTVLGLGPGAPHDLTLEAWRILEDADEIWLRTYHHPVVAGFPQGLDVHAFDEVYEHAESFAEVYETIVERVLSLGAREQGVIYGVPGHPLVGEATVVRILEAADSDSMAVRVVGGLSFVEPTLAALALDALDGLQIFDALDLISLNHPPLNPDFPALIGQVYNRQVASALKLVLMNQYGDEHPTALIDAAGTERERVDSLPLYQIDRQPVSPLTSLYVAPLSESGSFEGFQQTVAKLRAPDGCPWDREQTHKSLRTNLLEESYEVLSVIDAEDPEALREELGDLLLQIVLHAQIAVEMGEFRMSDVIAGINAKLKRRHPHVWGKTEVANVGEVITNWETIKRQEREGRGEEDRSLLDGVPEALPALAQADAYLDRAGRLGFDLTMVAEGAVESLVDCLREAQGGELDREQLGQDLLALVKLAQDSGLDPESALREASLQFAQRFRVLEAEARRRNTSIDDIPPEAIRRLWREA